MIVFLNALSKLNISVGIHFDAAEERIHEKKHDYVSANSINKKKRKETNEMRLNGITSN